MATTTTAPATSQLWAMIHEQRGKVADVLASLSAEEWDTPSACAGWRVRDVAAHMLETHLMTPGRFALRFAASGFRFNSFAAAGVARHAADSPAEILAQYRQTMNRTTSPPGPKPTWLAEAVIHGEDIARPTGRSVPVSADALVAVAEFVRGSTPLLHGKQRSAGLRLHATDVDWAAGAGPEVSGPAASLILAITGRGAALSDLSGDGVQILRERITS